MFRIWCEYDIGNAGIVFSSKKKATDWLKTNAVFLESVEADGVSFNTYVKDSGLVGFTKLIVDPS